MSNDAAPTTTMRHPPYHVLAPGARPRRRSLLPVVVLAALIFAGVPASLATTPARAAAGSGSTNTQSFTTAGTYSVTVPANTVDVQVKGVGGAGNGGNPSADYDVPGSAGGSGSEVDETLAVGVGDAIQPGDTLTVVVGKRGGGGRGGDQPDALGLAGTGGSGGGATVLLSASSKLLLVAGGGGGGGGAGSIYFFGTPGGDGGSFGAGQASTWQGAVAGMAGTYGPNNCPAGGPRLISGDDGETPASGTGAGAGGGGGAGYCGGGAGGSGDHGAGRQTPGLGGGGGGAGGDFSWSGATDVQTMASTNIWDGSLTLSFMVAPATATPSSSSIDFGAEPVGTASPPKYVTLANNGDLPLKIYGLSIAGADPGDFSLDLGTCSSSTVAPHSSCQLGASFKPTTADHRSSTLYVSDDAGDSPQVITLTGTGQTPASATLSSSSIDLGTQQVGTASTPQYVTLTNNGDLPLTVGGLDLRGADPQDFSGASGTCGSGYVAPHASCQLGASFKPTAAGDRSAALLVYDSAGESPQAITLTGTGQAPASATFSSSSIAFGGQPIGTASHPQYVTLTNDGDLPLTLHALTASGIDPRDFSGDLGTCHSGTVAPHASCQLGASFNPSAAGDRSGSLVVVGSGGVILKTITLTGTGQSTVTDTLSSSSIAFGGQPVGIASQPQYVTVTNNGDLPLTIYGLDSRGSDKGDFIGDLGTCGSGYLAPHSSCQVGARFKPTDAVDRSATLLVDTSAPDSPLAITLTGTGAAPQTTTLNATDPPVTPTGSTPAPTSANRGSQTPTAPALSSTGNPKPTSAPLHARPTTVCVVPRLVHATLSHARTVLSRAHCRLGTVHSSTRRSHHHVRHVSRQSARTGTRHSAGYRVNVWLG